MQLVFSNIHGLRVIKGREYFQIMEIQLIRLNKQTGKIEHIRGQRFPARK